jgi:hypothetical protein
MIVSREKQTHTKVTNSAELLSISHSQISLCNIVDGISYIDFFTTTP